MPATRGRYWLATLSAQRNVWTPRLIDGLDGIKGQLELGQDGYLHWQLAIYVRARVTLAQLKSIFPRDIHLELVRNREAAFDYVWKDDTCADPNSRFSFGELPVRRNARTDWDLVRNNARSGRFDDIPADVLVRYYGNLKRIHIDALALPWRHDIECYLYYGDPGTGKTRRAFFEAGEGTFVKSSTTKWWDGYAGQQSVIIDDFSGLIRVDYLKTWLDRYPCSVEVKGGAVALCATRFFITSNFSMDEWGYKDVDVRALRRRFTNVIHFSENFGVWSPPINGL